MLLTFRPNKALVSSAHHKTLQRSINIHYLIDTPIVQGPLSGLGPGPRAPTQTVIAPFNEVFYHLLPNQRDSFIHSATAGQLKHRLFFVTSASTMNELSKARQCLHVCKLLHFQSLVILCIHSGNIY